MANPDGVVHGNSRTNIKGYDINRLWEINKTSSIACNETSSINRYLINY
jgi:murein tripeptide amidase MpaA